MSKKMPDEVFLKGSHPSIPLPIVSLGESSVNLKDHHLQPFADQNRSFLQPRGTDASRDLLAV